jgi:hypothetical protein
MMLEEFEQRTGYRPTLEQYQRIEAAYMSGNYDKDAFCRKWVEDGGIENEEKKYKWDWVEYQHHYEGKRHTNKSLMEKIFEIVESMPEFEKARGILDYKLAESFTVRELTNYGFEFLAVTNFGCEGIYIDCWLRGEFCGDPSKNTISMGTLKTLERSLEAMKIMGELAGVLTWVATEYIDENIDQFSPEGQKMRKWTVIS